MEEDGTNFGVCLEIFESREERCPERGVHGVDGFAVKRHGCKSIVERVRDCEDIVCHG